MIVPTMPAKIAPMTIAIARRSPGAGTAAWSAAAAIAPEKAPTLMKPAWPRLSSPRTPTVRFRLSAMTT